MELSNKCPQCNTELVCDHDESTLTWTCPNCEWGIATTYISPIEQDETKYKIIILPNLSPNLTQLKTLSRMIGKNFIETKKILSANEFTPFEGKAIDMLPIKAQLTKAEIDFKIIPDFIY